MWRKRACTLLWHPRTVAFRLLTSRCDYRTNHAFVSGSYVVQNPYGELPASIFGNYPLYWLLLLCYLGLLLYWAYNMFSHKSELMGVHTVILVGLRHRRDPQVLLVVCELGCLTRVAYLHSFNRTGTSKRLLEGLSVLLNCVMQTMLRLMVLMVSLG